MDLLGAKHTRLV